MAKTVVLIYRCLRCGHEGRPKASGLEQADIDYVEACIADGRYGMTGTHNCEAGRIGVTQLIGAEEVEE